MLRIASKARKMALCQELRTDERSDILLRYRTASPQQCLDYQPYGNIVLQLNAQQVVKFGPGISRDEAENQARVYQIVDQRIVRIPRVDSWFQDDRGWGYLVMEYVHGRRADTLAEPMYTEPLLKVLQHLHSLKSQSIDPLHQGPHRAILFGEGPSPELRTVQDVEAWFTRRLLDKGARLDLSNFDLVLCHLDFSCRNLLWEDGQPPCLLD